MGTAARIQATFHLFYSSAAGKLCVLVYCVLWGTSRSSHSFPFAVHFTTNENVAEV